MVMNSSGDPAASQRLVRRFSEAVYAHDPDDDLARALVSAGATTAHADPSEQSSEAQWMQLFRLQSNEDNQKTPDEIILEGATAELVKAYKKFLPKEHHAQIEDGPPRLQDVFEALSIANEKWGNNREATKTGRMRALFTKSGKNLHKSRELFAMVPSGDKYVSLLAGSFSAMIKATVNHAKIAESVSKALDDLSEDISHWKDRFEYDERSAAAEHYVARLYVVVFNFLAKIMVKWSSRSSTTRLLRSFDSDFLKEEIEDKKKDIRHLEDSWRRHSDLMTQKAMKASMREQRDMYDNQTKSQMEFQACLIAQMNDFKTVGWQLKTMLEQRAYRDAPTMEMIGQLQQSILGAQELKALPAEPAESRNVKVYAREELHRDSSSILRGHAAPQDTQPFLDQAQHLEINSDLLLQVQEWNASTTSQLLWICGPFMAPQPSRYTLLSAYVEQVAQKAKVPVVYHFCQRETTLMELAYDVLAQVLRIMPEEFESEKDFSSTRFGSLNHTNATLQFACGLIRDLISVGPNTLFVIIDGLQWLDEPGGSVRVQDLLNAIRFADEEDEHDKRHLIKLFCTTDGVSEALNNMSSSRNVVKLDYADEDGPGVEGDELETTFL